MFEHAKNKIDKKSSLCMFNQLVRKRKYYFLKVTLCFHATFFNVMESSKSAVMDDATLIIECVKGNVRAQKALFERFARKMMGVCLRYCKNTDQAEDVLQDGFVKVFSKLKDFKQEGSLEGWIRRVMVNTALDQIRKDLKILGDTNIDDVAFKIEGTEHVFAQLAADDLMLLIQSMPEGYKVVFNMFAIEGYSHQEIASTLGISENTSKSQYSRARAYLRERIENK
jgi:RNA polymerase sigma-70 factor (ECF subfamily)